MPAIENHRFYVQNSQYFFCKIFSDRLRRFVLFISLVFTVSVFHWKLCICFWFFNAEEENTFEIDEKPADLNEAENTEDQNEEDTGEAEKGDQDAEPAEEGISEDKEEKEDEGEKDADEQEGNTENTEEAEEEESQPPDEEKNESAEEEKEKGIPAGDQGLQPQVQSNK